MIPPQRCPRNRGTETGSSKAPGCSETSAESGRGIPGKRGSIHLWLSSIGSLTATLLLTAGLRQPSSSVSSEGHEGRPWAGLCGRTEKFCPDSACLSGSAAGGIRGYNEDNCKLTTRPWKRGKEWNGFDRALRTFLEAEEHTGDWPFPTSSCTSQAEPPNHPGTGPPLAFSTWESPPWGDGPAQKL